MDLDTLFACVSGYERVGDEYRLYVDGPVPRSQLHRRVGERTPLFHLFAGEDAGRVEEWLARNGAWQCLRVPTYDRAKGVRAVLTAEPWRGGDGSALSDLGRDHVIRDEDHRERLRREVELLVGMVLENPVRVGKLEELHDIQDVVNAGPVGVELATTAEVIAAYFGGG
ncbi:hypothetical protein J0H58_14805 [bacterium]|nr:hypothetical protein [bacterium]